MRDPSGPGFDEEPAPYIDQSWREDMEYDAFRERVDSGEQCPVCKGHREITKETALGVPLFVCACGERWFDFVTRPTEEEA